VTGKRRKPETEAPEAGEHRSFARRVIHLGWYLATPEEQDNLEIHDTTEATE